MNNDCELIKTCRLCDSSRVTNVWEFGETALANNYLVSLTAEDPVYPLTVLKCCDCGHFQLRETIKPEVLFSNYLYASSDSPALNVHFQEYAEDLSRSLPRDPTSAKVLEVACNDGVLIRQLEKAGYKNIVGVDPARNIARVAAKNTSAKIYTEYFNREFASHLTSAEGQFDLVCANNVLAHVADIHGFTEGIAKVLADDGVFVLENAYLLDTIQGLYFDQVYHEHLQYFGIKPLSRFLSRYGFEIFKIKRVSTQGGSFRVFAKKVLSAKYQIDSSVREFMEREEQYELYSTRVSAEFLEKLNSLKQQFQLFLLETSQAGKTVSCYGCPAKFALFSRFLGLNKDNIQYVVDDSPLKYGKFAPGSKIPIVSGAHFKDNPTDYCIIAVWNMKDSIVARNKNYQGKFVVPLPRLEFL